MKMEWTSAKGIPANLKAAKFYSSTRTVSPQLTNHSFSWFIFLWIRSCSYVLTQKQWNGTLRPVAYCTRSLQCWAKVHSNRKVGFSLNMGVLMLQGLLHWQIILCRNELQTFSLIIELKEFRGATDLSPKILNWTYEILLYYLMGFKKEASCGRCNVICSHFIIYSQ